MVSAQFHWVCIGTFCSVSDSSQPVSRTFTTDWLTHDYDWWTLSNSSTSVLSSTTVVPEIANAQLIPVVVVPVLYYTTVLLPTGTSTSTSTARMPLRPIISQQSTAVVVMNNLQNSKIQNSGIPGILENSSFIYSLCASIPGTTSRRSW
jgi:hypothetical protein